MKQKMTAIDVRALCLLLKKKLVGLRLANVYDVSGRLYLLKLSKANRKEHLLIESGIRIHTTEFLRNKKDVPSGFSMKLRKHLRTKKLENLTQLGVDRVIDLQFGKGENAYHILVELYASGNVILTDHEYTILSLLRSHKFDETSKIQIKEKYPFTASAGMTIDSIFVTDEDIKKFIDGEPEKEDKPLPEGEGVEGQNNQAEGGAAAESEAAKQSKGGKGGKAGGKQDGKKGGKQSGKQDKKKDVINMKSVLTKMVPYINFPYAEHVLKQLGQDPNIKASIEQAPVLREAALKCQQLMRDLETSVDIKGYLIYQEKPTEEKRVPQLENKEAAEAIQKPEADESQETEQDKKFKGKLLKDFGPIPLAQFASEPTLEYESFDNCVDEYFSQLDKQREQTKFTSKEDEIWKKMSRIKDDQHKRIQGLQKEQDLSEFKAQLLQKYIFEVQAIVDILQVMLTSGIAWNDINRMVKEEKKAANPLANLIYKINFEKNQVTLMLDACNEEDENSSEFSVDDKFTNLDPVVRVDVDLLLSAQMNIRKYFEIKKKSYEKEVKTKNAADIAIRDAEANALKEITKHRQTQKMDKMRKVFWFEKFDWFISSENYLCISGKNAQQNEALVKKYMDKGDLFMHTDMPGAAVTIIKNPSGQIVPPITLNEAAIFEVCHSRAWEGKIVTSVYWVHADQVSKTPPTGLYIPTGSFMIRGKRNIMTPSKLELGFTLMFSLNEESIANHIGERRPRLQQDEMADATSLMQSEMMTEGELDMDMMDLDDGEGDGEQDQEEGAADEGAMPTPSISRQISTATQKVNQSMVTENEQYKVVQVGEDRELMEKKRQQAHERKQKQKEQQGKTKDQIRADNKKKVQQKEEMEAIAKQGQKEKQQVRGAKQKIKKIKEKYADQDEEERERRLEMLGAKKIKGFDQKIGKNKQAKGHKDSNNKATKGNKKNQQQQEEEEEKQEAVQDAQEQVLEETVQEEENQQDAQTEEQIDTTTAAVATESEIIDQTINQQQQEGLEEQVKEEEVNDEEEKKEIEQLMKEEDINLVAESEDLNEIDKLTGVPKPNDLLLAVVPMCAPYSAIQTYKYKVKIQPGTLKRGRAMKLIKSLFLAQANKNQWDTMSIKSIPDADMTNMLLNNCRVLAPGLTKMQNASKQNKKKGPKAD